MRRSAKRRELAFSPFLISEHGPTPKRFKTNELIEANFRNIFTRTFNEHVDNYVEIAARLAVDSELLIGRGAAVEDSVNVLDFLARTEWVEDFVNKFEEFADQVFYRDFLLLSEVEKQPIKAVAEGPPLVLLDQPAVVETKAKILVYQNMQLRDDGLE